MTAAMTTVRLRSLLKIPLVLGYPLTTKTPDPNSQAFLSSNHAVERAV